MNVDPEPPSNTREAADTAQEHVPLIRRSGRLKRPLDFSAIVGKRKNKKKKNVEADPNLKEEVDVKVEKSVLEISFPLNDEESGDPFLISSENPVGQVLEELDDLRSSESTMTADSESDRDDPVYMEHSYAISPPKKSPIPVKMEKLPPIIVVPPAKDAPDVEIAPPPTREPVSIGTLAVYRALIDHCYSALTPAALIEAIMIKHEYICSLEGIEDYSSDIWLGHADPEPTFYDTLRMQLGEEAVITPAPNLNRDQGAALSPRRESSSEAWCSRTSPVKIKTKRLIKNPKFGKSAKSPNAAKKKPKPKVQHKGGNEKKKADLSPKIKKNKGTTLSTLSSKLKVEIKKRKRRTNQTGWPTTKKPQTTKSSDKSEPKKPKVRSPRRQVKKVEVRSSRDTSSSRSSPKDDQERTPVQDVVVSIEEAVKRRRQLKSSADVKPTKGVKKHRKKRNVKSVYQSRSSEVSPEVPELPAGATVKKDQSRSENESDEAFREDATKLRRKGKLRGAEAVETKVVNEGNSVLEAAEPDNAGGHDVRSPQPEAVEPEKPKKLRGRPRKHPLPTIKSQKPLARQVRNIKIEDSSSVEREPTDASDEESSKNDSQYQPHDEGDEKPSLIKGQAVGTRKSLRTRVKRHFASLFKKNRSAKTRMLGKEVKKENLTSEGDELSGSESGSNAAVKSSRGSKSPAYRKYRRKNLKVEELGDTQGKKEIKLNKSKSPVVPPVRAPKKRSNKSKLMQKDDVPTKRGDEESGCVEQFKNHFLIQEPKQNLSNALYNDGDLSESDPTQCCRDEYDMEGSSENSFQAHETEGDEPNPSSLEKVTNKNPGSVQFDEDSPDLACSESFHEATTDESSSSKLAALMSVDKTSDTPEPTYPPLVDPVDSEGSQDVYDSELENPEALRQAVVSSTDQVELDGISADEREVRDQVPDTVSPMPQQHWDLAVDVKAEFMSSGGGHGVQEAESKSTVAAEARRRKDAMRALRVRRRKRFWKIYVEMMKRYAKKKKRRRLQRSANSIATAAAAAHPPPSSPHIRHTTPTTQDPPTTPPAPSVAISIKQEKKPSQPEVEAHRKTDDPSPDVVLSTSEHEGELNATLPSSSRISKTDPQERNPVVESRDVNAARSIVVDDRPSPPKRTQTCAILPKRIPNILRRARTSQPISLSPEPQVIQPPRQRLDKRSCSQRRRRRASARQSKPQQPALLVLPSNTEITFSDIVPRFHPVTSKPAPTIRQPCPCRRCQQFESGSAEDEASDTEDDESAPKERIVNKTVEDVMRDFNPEMFESKEEYVRSLVSAKVDAMIKANHDLLWKPRPRRLRKKKRRVVPSCSHWSDRDECQQADDVPSMMVDGDFQLVQLVECSEEETNQKIHSPEDHAKNGPACLEAQKMSPDLPTNGVDQENRSSLHPEPGQERCSSTQQENETYWDGIVPVPLEKSTFNFKASEIFQEDFSRVAFESSQDEGGSVEKPPSPGKKCSEDAVQGDPSLGRLPSATREDSGLLLQSASAVEKENCDRSSTNNAVDMPRLPAHGSLPATQPTKNPAEVGEEPPESSSQNIPDQSLQLVGQDHGEPGIQEDACQEEASVSNPVERIPAEERGVKEDACQEEASVSQPAESIPAEEPGVQEGACQEKASVSKPVESILAEEPVPVPENVENTVNDAVRSISPAPGGESDSSDCVLVEDETAKEAIVITSEDEQENTESPEKIFLKKINRAIYEATLPSSPEEDIDSEDDNSDISLDKFFDQSLAGSGEEGESEDRLCAAVFDASDSDSEGYQRMRIVDKPRKSPLERVRLASFLRNTTKSKPGVAGKILVDETRKKTLGKSSRPLTHPDPVRSGKVGCPRKDDFIRKGEMTPSRVSKPVLTEKVFTRIVTRPVIKKVNLPAPKSVHSEKVHPHYVLWPVRSEEEEQSRPVPKLVTGTGEYPAALKPGKQVCADSVPQSLPELKIRANYEPRGSSKVEVPGISDFDLELRPSCQPSLGGNKESRPVPSPAVTSDVSQVKDGKLVPKKWPGGSKTVMAEEDRPRIAVTRVAQGSGKNILKFQPLPSVVSSEKDNLRPGVVQPVPSTVGTKIKIPKGTVIVREHGQIKLVRKGSEERWKQVKAKLGSEDSVEQHDVNREKEDSNQWQIISAHSLQSQADSVSQDDAVSHNEECSPKENGELASCPPIENRDEIFEGTQESRRIQDPRGIQDSYSNKITTLIAPQRAERTPVIVRTFDFPNEAVAKDSYPRTYVGKNQPVTSGPQDSAPKNPTVVKVIRYFQQEPYVSPEADSDPLSTPRADSSEAEHEPFFRPVYSPPPPGYSLAQLPFGSDDVNWRNIRFYPTMDMFELMVRVRRRLAKNVSKNGLRIFYRKGGRPPFSYVELCSLAIENSRWKSVRSYQVVEFVARSFEFFKVSQSKNWQLYLKQQLWNSDVFRSDRFGKSIYYTFSEEYKLPDDPDFFERSDDYSQVVHQGDAHDDADKTPEPLPEAEPNPLIPICTYSDDDGEESARGNSSAMFETSEPVLPPDVSETVGPSGCDPLAAETQTLYTPRALWCIYCSMAFSDLQSALDHATSHDEMDKLCPACNFNTPDPLQLTWHVNAHHS